MLTKDKAQSFNVLDVNAQVLFLKSIELLFSNAPKIVFQVIIWLDIKLKYLILRYTKVG